MKKRKTLVLTAAIALIVMSVFILNSRPGDAKTGGFRFAPVTFGDLENTVSSTGTISALETVEVGSQVSGIIEKLYADYNSPVRKGELLAVLDKTLFNVGIKDAEAQVFKARARLEQARAEVKRNRPLFEKGHLSEMEYLVTQTTAKTAEGDLKAAQAALNRARTQLKYTEIRSPINGTVIERTVDLGQTIAASFQAPRLFTIAEDLTRMQIEVDVDESDIGLIKEGQRARFTVQAYPDEVFSGEVRQVRLQPTTIQNVVNYTVVVDAANQRGKLLPGMTATVDFVVEARRDVLLVSNSALTYTPSAEEWKHTGLSDAEISEQIREISEIRGQAGNQRTPANDDMGRVFCLDETGKPRVMTFKKGLTNGRFTEVLANNHLKEGMRVITAFNPGGQKAAKKSGITLPKPPGGGPRQGL